MKLISPFFILCLFSSSLLGQYAETFSDYFGSSEDFALRQLAKNTEGKTDTLLGHCVDSLRAGNVEAVHKLANQVLQISPNEAFGYLFRSVARADLDSMSLAYQDVDHSIELAPNLMLAYSTKARFFLSEDEPKKARNTLDIASIRMPDRPEPVFLLGALDWQSDHKIRARKQWEISVARDSCYAPARIAILAQRMVMGKLGKGIGEIEDLLRCQDISPDIFYLLAIAERRRNHDEEAMRYINDALDLSPGQSNYLSLRSDLFHQQGNDAAAVEDLYDVYAALSSPRRRSSFGLSMFNEREKMEAALNYYMLYKSTYPAELRAILATQLVQLYYRDEVARRKSIRTALTSKFKATAPVLYYAALAEMNYFENERSLELTEAALMADPDIPDLYRIRGQYYSKKKDYRSAYKDFAKLHEMQPKNLVPIYGLSKCLEATNRLRPAINMYNKILTIDSSETDALNRIGAIYLAQQNFSAANTYLDLYLEEVDDQASARYDRALCRYLLGDVQGASKDLQQLSDAYLTHNLEAQNLRAVVHTAQDSLKLALREFNTILFRDNNYTDAYLNRSRIYAKQADWVKCIADLDIVIAANPESPFAFYERGIAKAELKSPGACSDIQQAISLGHQVSTEVLARICGP